LTFRGTHAYIATGKEVIAVDRKVHTEASVKRQELFVSRGNVRGDRAKLTEIDRQMAELAQAGILWKQPFAAESSIALAGNAVLVGGMDEVRAYDLNDGKEAWTAKVDGEVRGLAIASGRLLVSTTRGSIYAFGASQPAAGEAAVRSDSQGTDAFPRDTKSEFYEQAAREILAASGVTSGYCLVLGSEEGRLAYELARQAPKLRIYAIEPDEAKVQRSRERFAAAGWYGTRVTVFTGEPDKTGLSNYFANLVVSDSMLSSGKLPATAVELGRYVKPCGGAACFGSPGAATVSTDDLKTALAGVYLRDDAQIEAVDQWVVLRRGKLAGAGEWSHQYGSPDNACFSNDERVKGSLGVLWYGDPGPNKMVNRHEAAARRCRPTAASSRRESTACEPTTPTTDSSSGNTKIPAQSAPASSTIRRRATWRPATTRCLSSWAIRARNWTPLPVRSRPSTKRPRPRTASSAIGVT
jgi:hypothetical protein